MRNMPTLQQMMGKVEAIKGRAVSEILVKDPGQSQVEISEGTADQGAEVGADTLPS